VANAGTGSGTVTSSPSGISCGTTCSASYASGTSVTLTASPASGSSFAGWTGCDVLLISGGCQMNVTANKSVTATLNLPVQQTVTLSPTANNMLSTNSLESTEGNTVNQNYYPIVGLFSLWSASGYGSWEAFASALKYNTSVLAGKTIDSAILTLEVRSMWVGYYPVDFEIGAFASSWSASSITWNSVVASATFWTASWQSFNYPYYSGQLYDIDLTAVVQNWANGTWTNNGLILESTSYLSPGNVDSIDNYDFWVPDLVVTYH
jgi:hypothetical protein